MRPSPGLAFALRLGTLACLASVAIPKAARADENVAPAVAPALATVSIDSPDPVRLETLADGQWKTVCVSPCDKAVPMEGSYRIDGDGIRPSAPFRLRAPHVRLHVDPSSSTVHGVGIGIAVVGAPGVVPAIAVTGLAAVGIVFGAILICPILAAWDKSNGSAYGECMGSIFVGIGQAYTLPYVWIPAVAGGALAAIGGGMMIATPPTAVTPEATTAYTRKPEWKPLPLPTPRAAAMTLPLVNLSF